MAALDLQPLDIRPALAGPAPNGSIPVPNPVTPVSGEMGRKLDIQPLDLQPVGQEPGKLDLQPLDLQPVGIPTERKPEEAGVFSRSEPQDEKIREIALRNGVDPKDLVSIAPLYGVVTTPHSLGEAMIQGAKQSAGTAGRSIGLGIPQWLYKKAQTDENYKKALDEVRELGHSQRGYLESGLEMVTGGATNAPKKALSRIGQAAGIGATAGLAESREGQELSGAAKGAAFGGVLGASLEGVSAGVSKLLSPAEKELARSHAINVTRDTGELANRTRQSENTLREIIVGEKTALTRPEIDNIVEEQLGREGLQAHLDPATPEGRSIREQIDGPITDQSIREKLVSNLIEDRAFPLARELGYKGTDTEEALGTIERLARKDRGPEFLQSKYDPLLDRMQSERSIQEKGHVASKEPSAVGRGLNFFSARQWIQRHIDDLYGVGAQRGLEDLNKATGRMSFPMESSLKDLDRITSVAEKNGTLEAARDSGKIAEALRTGNEASLTPAERATAELYQQHWNNTAHWVSEPKAGTTPLPVHPEAIPSVVVDTDKIVPIVERKLDSFLKEVSNSLGRTVTDLAQLTPKELSQLRRNGTLRDIESFVNWTRPEGEGRILLNPQDFSRELKEKLFTREGRSQVSQAARRDAAAAPQYLMENDLNKLTAKYTRQLMREHYLSDSLNRLSKVADRLDSLGADYHAQFIRNMIADVHGTREGTLAHGIQRATSEYGNFLDKQIDKFGHHSWQGYSLNLAKNMPQLMYSALHNVYQNVLYGPHTVLTNFASNYARLVPELGYAYGIPTAMKATLATARNFRRNLERAHFLGTYPADVGRAGARSLAQGLLRNKGFQLGAEGMDKLGNAMMVGFRSSEQFNRAVTMSVADQMAYDLVRGSKGALQAITNFPPYVQKTVQAAGRNEKIISDSLAKYLNDVVSLNYNKASNAQFASTVGPLFSTFSKWPTEMLGETVYRFRKGGLGGGSREMLARLALPWGALKAADYILGEAEQGDRAKKFVGSKGLASMAPMGALLDFAEGKQFSPPAVHVLYEGLIKPALEGEPAKASKGFDAALQDFAPGAGLLRFVTDDLVTLVTGERPAGSSFTERTQEGLRRITK